MLTALRVLLVFVGQFELNDEHQSFRFLRRVEGEVEGCLTGDVVELNPGENEPVFDRPLLHIPFVLLEVDARPAHPHVQVDGVGRPPTAGPQLLPADVDDLQSPQHLAGEGDAQLAHPDIEVHSVALPPPQAFTAPNLCSAPYPQHSSTP